MKKKSKIPSVDKAELIRSLERTIEKLKKSRKERMTAAELFELHMIVFDEPDV